MDGFALGSRWEDPFHSATINTTACAKLAANMATEPICTASFVSALSFLGRSTYLLNTGNKEGEVANEGQGNIVGKQHDLIHFFDAVEQRMVNKKQECNYYECRYLHKEAGP